MVHLERFLSKLLLISSVFLLSSCIVSNNNIVQKVNSDEVVFKSKMGVFYVNKAIFNGSIFKLYANGWDTAYVHNYFGGKEHGVWKQFFSNSQLKEIRYFKNGKKHGEYLAWWSNGKKKLSYHFVYGEYEGNCKEWNTSGFLIKDMNYHKGHEVGSQKSWYNNGSIKANYVVKNGRRYGLLGTKNCTNVAEVFFKE